ncbi:NAD-dependent epimerase/dehydratase family protein [Mangrovibacterium lignilyticum]|uniref:NAD-dependent epimerase/dehydratase family protein n=1 Tax=Mangrovibacterium lignilyticum TaxID=2668052 RepID=UPI0013D39E07|nr:NAD-dependent epimerase/dehydratase family protein [Mangrovibacterium lignilyticum]
MQKILITGGAGFIGSHVAEYFCNRKLNVFCLVKKTTDLTYIEHLPVHIVYGDIRSLSSFVGLLKDMDSIIHIAGLVKDWGKYKDFYDTNVTGTLNVLKACEANGITNIIITGSISSYGEEDSKEVKTENSPFNSHYKYFFDSIFPCKMNYYRDTKAMCTKEALRYAQENNLNLTIIEPTWVYGEREFNTGFFTYLKTVKSKILFFPGSKRNKFNVIYAKDLARAYFLAFEKALKGINRIIVGNRENEQMDYIFSIFCNELGVTKPVNISWALIYPLGFILELIYTLFQLKSPPLLSRGRVNMFYDNIEFSTEKAKSLLSYSNEYSLQEGIKRTVNWYKKQHLI